MLVELSPLRLEQDVSGPEQQHRCLVGVIADLFPFAYCGNDYSFEAVSVLFIFIVVRFHKDLSIFDLLVLLRSLCFEELNRIAFD